MSSDGSRPLGELVTLRRGSTYRSALLDQDGPVLLGLSSIARNGGFRRDSLRTYGGESPPEITLHPGDLYVSLKDVTQSADLLGSAACVPSDIPVGRLTQDTVKLTFREGYADYADYVFWLLRTPQYREYCRVHAIGVTTLALPREDFLAFPVPPLTPERAAAIRSLRALDDKIEHNLRLARRLDSLAEMTFRHRFVRLPATREISTVGEKLTCILGGTPSRRRPEFWVGGTIPWVNSSQANEFRVVRPSDLITDAGLASSAAKLLPAGTTIVAITGATMGKVSRLEIDACTNQSLVGILASETLPSEFIHYWIRESVHELLTRQTGAAQQHVNKGDIESLPLLVPNPDELAGFMTLARPGLRLIARLLFQAEQLKMARDVLLPKLVSGGIAAPAEAAGVAIS